jgi:hypothetical protein
MLMRGARRAKKPIFGVLHRSPESTAPPKDKDTVPDATNLFDAWSVNFGRKVSAGHRSSNEANLSDS